MATATDRDRITIADIEISNKILKKQIKRVDDDLRKFKQRADKLLKWKANVDINTALSKLNKYNDKLKELQKSAEKTAQSIRKITAQQAQKTASPADFKKLGANIGNAVSNQYRQAIDAHIRYAEQKINEISGRTLRDTGGLSNIRRIVDEIKNIRIDRQIETIVRKMESATTKMVKSLNDQMRAIDQNSKMAYELKVKWLNEYIKKYQDHTNQIQRLDQRRAPSTSGGRVQSLFRLDARELSGSIDSVRQLMQSMATRSAEINFQMKQQTQKLMSDNINEVRQAQLQITNILRTAHEKDLAGVKQYYAQKLQAVRGNERQEQKLVAEQNSVIEQLEQQHRARIFNAEKVGQNQLTRLREEENRQATMSTEERMKRQRELIIRYNREAGRILRDSQRQIRDATKDFMRSTGRFKLDILQIDTIQPIKDMRTLKQALQTNSKEINALVTREFRNMESNSVEEIRKGERNILNIMRQSHKQQLSEINRANNLRVVANSKTANQSLRVLRESYNKERQLAGNNHTLLREAEQRFQEQRQKIIRDALNQRQAYTNETLKAIERAEQQHQTRLKAIQRTATQRRQEAPSETQVARIGSTPIFGRINQAVSGGAQMLGGYTGQLGMLGGALQKLGPAGMAAGAALAGFTKILKAGVKAQEEFEFQTARITTLLSDTQSNQLPQAMMLLDDISVSVGANMNDLQRTFYNVVSAVPALANNLSAVSNVVEKSAKTGKALGATTEEVALALTNMGNAAGIALDQVENVDYLLDVLAGTMKMGVIPSGQQLALNIARTAPAMSSLTSDTKEAVGAIGAMTATLTANGVIMSESQTQIKALAQEMLNAEKRAKILELGIKGINPKGQITDWKAFIESASGNLEEMMAIFTSAEAENALRILAKNSGEAFKQTIDQVMNSAGLANEMYQKVADTGKQASERLTSSWERFTRAVGKDTAGAWGAIKSGLAGVLNAVSGWLETSEDKYNRWISGVRKGAEEARLEYEKLKSSFDNLDDSINMLEAEFYKVGDASELSAEQMAKFDELTQKAISEARKTSPALAEDIESIVNNKELGTVEGLNQIIDKLNLTKSIAQDDMFVKMSEGASKASSIFADEMKKIRSEIIDLGWLKSSTEEFKFTLMSGVGYAKLPLRELAQDSGYLLNNLDTAREKLQLYLAEVTRLRQEGFQEAPEDVFETKTSKGEDISYGIGMGESLADQEADLKNRLNRLEELEIASRVKINQSVEELMAHRVEKAKIKAEEEGRAFTDVWAEMDVSESIMTSISKAFGGASALPENFVQSIQDAINKQMGAIEETVVAEQQRKEVITSILRLKENENLTTEQLQTSIKMIIEDNDIILAQKLKGTGQLELAKEQYLQILQATMQQIDDLYTVGLLTDEQRAKLEEEQQAHLLNLYALDDKIAMHGESIDKQAQINQLTMEENLTKEITNQIIETKLKGYEGDLKAQIKILEGIKAENTARIEQLENEAEAIKAKTTMVMVGEKQILYYKNAQIQAQHNLLAGLNDIITADTARASDEEARLAAINAEIRALKTANKEIDKAKARAKIEEILAGMRDCQPKYKAPETTKTQRDGGSRARQAQDREIKRESRDASRQMQKEFADRQRFLQQQQQREQKVRDMMLERERKQHEEMIKAREKAKLDDLKQYLDRIDANRKAVLEQEKLADDLKDIRKSLVDRFKEIILGVSKTLGDLRNQIIPRSPEEQVETLIQESVSKYETFITTKNNEIAKINEAIKAEQERFERDREQLEKLNNDLIPLSASIGMLEQKIKGADDQLFAFNMRLQGASTESRTVEKEVPGGGARDGLSEQQINQAVNDLTKIVEGGMEIKLTRDVYDPVKEVINKIADTLDGINKMPALANGITSQLKKTLSQLKSADLKQAVQSKTETITIESDRAKLEKEINPQKMLIEKQLREDKAALDSLKKQYDMILKAAEKYNGYLDESGKKLKINNSRVAEMQKGLKEFAPGIEASTFMEGIGKGLLHAIGLLKDLESEFYQAFDEESFASFEREMIDAHVQLREFDESMGQIDYGKYFEGAKEQINDMIAGIIDAGGVDIELSKDKLEREKQILAITKDINAMSGLSEEKQLEIKQLGDQKQLLSEILDIYNRYYGRVTEMSQYTPSAPRIARFGMDAEQMGTGQEATQEGYLQMFEKEVAESKEFLQNMYAEYTEYRKDLDDSTYQEQYEKAIFYAEEELKAKQIILEREKKAQALIPDDARKQRIAELEKEIQLSEKIIDQTRESREVAEGLNAIKELEIGTSKALNDLQTEYTLGNIDSLELAKKELEILKKKQAILEGEQTATEEQRVSAEVDVKKQEKKVDEERDKKIKAGIAGFQGFMGFVDSAYDSVMNLSNILSAEAGKGEATIAAGDMAMMVGQQLLKAGGGFALAGAVILGAGMVGKFIGKIIKEFGSYEKTSLDRAQEAENAQNAILAVYKNQLDMMKQLQDYGDIRVDQAQEEYEWRKRILELEIFGESGGDIENTIYGGMTFEEIQDEIARLQNLSIKTGEIIGNLNIYSDDNREAKADAIFANLFNQFDQLPPELQKISEEAWDSYKDGLQDGFTSNEYQAIIDELTALQLGIDQDASKAQLVADFKQFEKSLDDLILEEYDVRLNLAMDIAIDMQKSDMIFAGYFDTLTAQYKDRLGKELSKLGYDISNMGTEQIKELLLQLSTDMGSEFSNEMADIAQNWLDAVSAEEDALTSLYEKQINILELRTEINAQDPDYLDEIDAYNQIIDKLEDQLELAIEQGFSEEYILELKGQILDYEERINDILNERNGIQDENLDNLIRQRDELLRSAREEGGLTSEDQAALQALEGQIRAILVSNGVPQDEIDDIMQAFQIQRYHSGGEIMPNMPVGREVPILAQAGEYMLSNSDVQKIGVSAIQDFIKNPNRMAGGGTMASYMITNNNYQSQNIDNIQVNGDSARELWQELLPFFDDYFDNKIIQREERQYTRVG